MDQTKTCPKCGSAEYTFRSRKKIEANPAKPKYILTEPWVGYRFAG